MTIHLVGGGRDEAWYAELYGPFLAEAGPEPEVACLLLDEGDVPEQFERWSAALAAAGACRPRVVPVLPGAGFDPSVLDGADAVFVGGGLTPEYAAALAGPLGRRLAERPLPYAGFSAGAAIAAERAVVGGWLSDGVPVCPEETAEDLAEIEVRDGLGLLTPAVDVHAAQWGTLGRLVEAVARGAVPYGLAIDENTALTVDGTTARVRGAGRVHLVRPDGDGAAAVRSYRAGEDLSF
ncbi:cyanophycinase [Streptomyces sp. TLI_235]|nr:Type 1 glutamine amidotransferase-like domain-containing protein [Streptomyces sp. TLI_235]PBC76220.1 cyanophycinase [Streptomyces sp. TLI_235]